MGLLVYSCLIYGAVEKSEKMLIPALVVIPINFVSGVITMILILSLSSLGVDSSAALINSYYVLIAAVAIPSWIAIYSFRQELQANTQPDYFFEKIYSQKINNKAVTMSISIDNLNSLRVLSDIERTNLKINT